MCNIDICRCVSVWAILDRCPNQELCLQHLDAELFWRFLGLDYALSCLRVKIDKELRLRGPA